jgi:hypothetical protein
MSPSVAFPTVKELKSQGISVQQAARSIEKFVNAPTTVREYSKLGRNERVATILSASKAIEAEKRKAKHREANKRYRERLKEFTKTQRGWIKAGHTLGLKNVVDTRAYVEYMEMRFAQSTDNSPYQISDFVDEYGAVINKEGYSPSDLMKDYNEFLLDREALIESGSYMNNGVDYVSGEDLFKDFLGMLLE